MTTTTTATAPSRRRGQRHPTADERAAAGRAARAVAPRASLGAWEAAPEREDPVATLQRQAESRVPELVPIRYGRMVASPFTFFRGGAAIMAADLADSPRTGLAVQLCGDAHLSNFGAFASADRRLVFSINDFDETLPGPFEWDVKRLVASFAVAARQQGFSAQKRRAIVMAAAGAYRRAMRSFAGMSSLEVWYTRLDVDDIARRFGADARAKQTIRRDTAKATSKNSLKASTKLTRVVDGTPQFISDPPVLSRLEELVGAEEATRFKATAETLVRSYKASLPNDRRVLIERYRFVDIARKVVGVGSVGTRAVGRAAARPRSRRPAADAGQGGPGLGPRAVPRRRPVQEPRAAGRRGPASDAGVERHPARLGAGNRVRRHVAATSTSVSSGTARVPPRSS